MITLFLLICFIIATPCIKATAVLRGSNKCNTSAEPFSISGVKIDFNKIRGDRFDMCGENHRVQHRLIKLLSDYNIHFELEPEEKVSFGVQLDEIMKGIREKMEEQRKKKRRSVVCGKYYWTPFISCITMECITEVYSQLDNLWCNTCGYIVIHPDDGYNFDIYSIYRFHRSEFIVDRFCTLNLLWVRGDE